MHQQYIAALINIHSCYYYKSERVKLLLTILQFRFIGLDKSEIISFRLGAAIIIIIIIIRSSIEKKQPTTNFCVCVCVSYERERERKIISAGN